MTDHHQPGQSPGYTTGALRQDGRDGAFFSPLWRLRIELTAPERFLLQTWPLRRLHFLHHSGASAFAYPLTFRRLQHTLGVLALVAHFCPDDLALRTAALLHDVGHYPFSHSAELVAGVDHHEMTRRRVTSDPIYGILRTHGLDAEHLLALMNGDPPNPLRTRNGLLHLDHLDSWVRQAQAAGFAEISGHALLAGLRLEEVNVAADQATAEYLVRLIRKGNQRHFAEGDIGPTTVLAHMLTLCQERGLIAPEELADATDEALLAQLAATADNKITELIELLWREPWRISVQRLTPGGESSDTHPSAGEPPDALVVNLDRLYDDVPLLAGTGQPITQVSAAARAEMAQIKELVGSFAVTWT